MKLYYYPLILCIGILSITGCSPDNEKETKEIVEQFSQDKPYTIEIKRFRSFYHAQELEKRLRSMGIPAYTYAIQDEQDEKSKWFVIATGAEKDSVDISKLRVELEIEHSLEELTVNNFENQDSLFLDLSTAEKEESKKIYANKPDIPESVFNLIKMFPENNMFVLKNVSLHNFPDVENSRRFRSVFYDASLDLPRGVSERYITDHASAFAEVIYEDNLYGDQVTVEIMQVRSYDGILEDIAEDSVFIKKKSADALPRNIAWSFAKRILNTGRYKTETYEPIYVKAFSDLYGYKVVIEPRTDYLRTYMILVDTKGEYVLFSQSTEKTPDELLKYLADFGKSDGILEYGEFYNTFFTIPSCLDDEDLFLGFSSEILDRGYARSKGYTDWSLAMVGHSTSTAHFYNKGLRKEWSCSAFDLITEGKKDYIYGDLYANHDSRGKEEVDVRDRQGFYVGGYSKEVNFSTLGRHIMAINGLSKDDLLDRARRFQSGLKGDRSNPCGDYSI